MVPIAGSGSVPPRQGETSARTWLHLLTLPVIRIYRRLGMSAISRDSADMKITTVFLRTRVLQGEHIRAFSCTAGSHGRRARGHEHAARKKKDALPEAGRLRVCKLVRGEREPCYGLAGAESSSSPSSVVASVTAATPPKTARPTSSVVPISKPPS